MADYQKKTDVFQLMSVRSPKTVEPQKLRNFYIRNEYIGPSAVHDQNGIPQKKLREIFSMSSDSEIGRLLYNKIFCESNYNPVREKNAEIVQAVLSMLPPGSVNCEVYNEPDPNRAPETLINDLEQNPYIYSDYNYYLIPETLETIACEFGMQKLLAAKKTIEKHTRSFNRENLYDELNDIFETDILTEIIYSDSRYATNYQMIRNILFDKLYILHILRHRASINLEYIMAGLQTLHTLEFLAVDNFVYNLSKGSLDITDQAIQARAGFISIVFEELKDFRLIPSAGISYFIDNKKELLTYSQSAPVIHPIVAKLHWYKQPFNDIKPIGIGDLKVVKQWLCGYQVGEISHIHNIMKGEEKERNLRHLEKTEEVFSFSSEQSKNNQQESQSTDRFEMKKEAEKIIKTDLSVNAHANFTYKQGEAIIVNVGGSFAYGNSNQDTQRSSSNYARDVMDKAVTQIQSRTSQQRSITKIFETEEKNNHKFTNLQPGATHTSGIYRWLDKKYNAQLYNYGKRMMFEFVIPEPAAFYVESKLKAAEIDIMAPQKPVKVVEPPVTIFNPETTQVPLVPQDITQDIFNRLCLRYDLGEFTYPRLSKKTKVIDTRNGKSVLQNAYGAPNDHRWVSDRFDWQMDDRGYRIAGVNFKGQARFWDQINEASNLDSENNRFDFWINGLNISSSLPNAPSLEPTAAIFPINASFGPNATNYETFDATDGMISVDLGFQDVDYYEITVLVELTLDPQYLLRWQIGVYNKISNIEQTRVDKINEENEIRYNAAMSDYSNKLNELNAQTVNDIIQGKSEAFNRQIIRDELKKHCISLIAKEFDAVETDDILSNEDALEPKSVTATYKKFFAGEVTVNSATETVVGFVDAVKATDYPKINIDIAKKKAKIIQFIEQAFEWQNIAYLCYPYFWAAEKKWIKLMNRLDYTDNNMTAFLKAGSVRVLLAVTPHYNDAVMHFIATREPWEGGPLPVIGDPFFIPLYEEIRKQQDDLQNATPEDKPWSFDIPTSLIYLQDSSSPIPADLICPEEEDE
jgi:hypothetical protein